MPPFKPPVNHTTPQSTSAGPRLAPGVRKRKPDGASNTTAAKRARQVEATRSNVLRDSPFLDPFHPAAAPYTFEPEMSVAESEELTRQLQHQELATATEGSREMGRPGDGFELGDAADADEDEYDSDAPIDPILRNDSQHRQHEQQDFIPASEDNRKQPSSSSLMSPISLTRPRPQVNPAQPFIPSGRTSTAAASRAPSATPSRPTSAVPSMRGSTPLSDAFGSRRTLATPASSVFKPTQRRHPVQPSKTSQATANQSFRTPDLPLARRAGFSTASDSVQRHPGGPPKQASANTAARAPSTAFSDKLADLDALVQNLASSMERLTVQSRTSAGLETQLHSVVEQNEVLREMVKEHRAEIDELKSTVNAQGTSLDELLTLINDHRSLDTLGPSTKSVDKATKAVRDNVFNAAVRHTFLHAMGISDSKQAATLEPLEQDTFWLECATRGAAVLRPNFGGSWTENVDWREDMIRYVRLKACEVYGQLREEHLNKKSNADITRQLKEVFENTRDAIKKGGKGSDAVEARNRKQRQHARKTRKNNERADREVRKETNTDSPEWDWFYQACYQSTDESDSGGGTTMRSLEFDSDTEDAPRAPKKSGKSKNPDATWTSRPPTYRDALINEKIDLMNTLVSNRRAERGGRNFSVPVVRGEPREKDLPRPGNNKPKILRTFVSAEWLADHQEQDTPTRICWLNQSEQNIQGQFADDGDQARNLTMGTNGKLF
ncbi:hypothetical protein DEU56DRAFT_754407 [Suillus clintonianus]|uniref:uncharacterized protein n=1 Tax=Suillus clintonianus TaxID=1904413 RepID=UPI001B875B2D|nr:uncharacterized protein DEU56DRAFT_754407 [Suillus clintonianus]KAG2143584.1 hypothetical protein DEU56DRAFT_754407 [Suillus clintonianus]